MATHEVLGQEELEQITHDVARVVQLGRTAMRLESEAHDIYRTLERHGSLEAPEGYHFLVRPIGDETPLTLEVQNPEYKMSKFEPVRDRSRAYELHAVRFWNGRTGFIGWRIEPDAEAHKIWVYADARGSRALFDNSSMVELSADEHTQALLRE
ncbi:MAG: hypothetical protein WDZ34_01580 [Candidatus Saccharimonadales bacterium]